VESRRQIVVDVHAPRGGAHVRDPDPVEDGNAGRYGLQGGGAERVAAQGLGGLDRESLGLAPARQHDCQENCRQCEDGAKRNTACAAARRPCPGRDHESPSAEDSTPSWIDVESFGELLEDRDERDRRLPRLPF
jgi:hypothetical protein